MPEMMTALFGGVGPAWESRNIPRPEPGTGQVMVRTSAVSLNNADVQILDSARKEGADSGDGYLAGYEFAGEVVALGEGAAGVAVGQRVMGTTQGGFAEYVLADHRHLFPVPPGLDDRDASTLPTALLTEHGAMQLGRLSSGQSVLITGATSGICLVGIQVARELGAGPILATTGSADSVDLLMKRGADQVVVTSQRGLAETILAATDGQGVDVSPDHVGGDTFAACLPATRVDGHVVNIGRLSGAESTIDLDALSYRHLTVRGVSFGFGPAAELGNVVAAATAALLPAIEAGRVTPVVDSVRPVRKAAAAAGRLRAGHAVGKPVLTWS